MTRRFSFEGALVTHRTIETALKGFAAWRRLAVPPRLAAMVAMAAVAAVPAAGQEPAAGQAPGTSSTIQQVITLEDALRLAEPRSEQVQIAEAGVTRAAGTRRLVQSERLPQLNGFASYDRALRSEFEGLFDAGTSEPCTPLQVDVTAPLEDRVAELERAYDCPPTQGFFGNGDGSELDLPFGRANTYRLDLAFSQALFTGGRLAAQVRQARIRHENAGLSLTSARAQTALDVAQAFYDAALADRLVQIAEETYAQADRSLAQTDAQRQAGRVAEFELLRARVARDTLQPQVVRARAGREIAYLRLKQLLEVPLDQPLSLQADLEDPVLPPPARFAPRLVEIEARGEQPVRVPVTQTANEVLAAEETVRIARAQRWPALFFTSNYGLVAYPSGFPGSGEWRTNWSVGASLSVPVLTGGRIGADVAIARAGVEEAAARLRLTRELAAVDTESARQELLAARAEWDASGSTIQQASRAYEIAELRYREGLSTQLELSDSRLLLAESLVTRARAARDLQVQRIRFALLPELPLGAGGTPIDAAAAEAAAAVAAQQLRTVQTAATAAATTPVATTSGTRGGQ
jgi:outer membrane protein TolC